MQVTPDPVESNPYLLGAYAPIAREIDAELEVVAGAIPKDLRGAYVRNGPNPRFAPRGRHHWFDGDAMLHAVRFEDGRAFYANRYVRTAGLEEEERAGHAVFSGIREPIAKERLPHPYKDTANTDVKFHHGSLLALWYLSGVPYRVDPTSLATLGPDTFGRDRACPVSAHVRIDPVTDEMMFFSYGPMPPFMRYGVVDREGRLVHHTDVALPGPRLPHDMAITEHYSILMDLPVFPDPAALARGRWKTAFHPDLPSRFGLVPRHGEGRAVRWFEASPCYIYHVVNAWEEGDVVVMDAHRALRGFLSLDPNASEYERMLHNLQMDAELYRYRFDLATGRTTEEVLDGRNTEFPSINARLQGRVSRYAYAMSIPRGQPLAFEGIVKHDTATGAAQELSFGPGVRGSESPFAPREGAEGEDDGYLVTFVHDEGRGRSEAWVIDARRVSDGPVARLAIPQRVPLGFHACWVEGAWLDAARKRRAPIP